MLSAIPLYFAAAYMIASGWESWAHRSLLHASRRSRRAWRNYGEVGALLRLAYFYHNTIHHRRTFRKSFFVQFDDQTQKRKLDHALKGSLLQRLEESTYGVTISGFWELFTFASVPVAFVTVEFALLAPLWLPIGILIALLPLLLTRYMHPLLHLDAEQHRSEPLRRLICAAPLFAYMQRYHFLHHKYGLVNFNLLLGADWIFRVRRSASADEVPR